MAPSKRRSSCGKSKSSITTTGSKRDRVHQKKKDKIQEKKTQFREKLKINQKILGSNRRVEKKSTKKRKKRTSQSLATMNKLAETLGDFAEYGNLALNVKPITSSKQRERVMKEEGMRMKQVLEHPVFQQDPLQAVMTHLEATLPPAPVVKSGGGRARMSS